MVEVSILIPAYNEEKTIGATLNNLKNLQDFNTEILVNVRGSTDGTRSIVRKYKFVKMLDGKKREGKAGAMEAMIKQSHGGIIIIHDADWIFHCDRQGIKKIINAFRDKKLGGISPANTFPWIYDAEKRKKVKSILFLGEAWVSELVWKYRVENFTKRIDRKLYADKDKMMFPFFCHMFRRSVIKSVDVVHDDTASTLTILNEGYKLMVWTSRNLPHFEIMKKQMSSGEAIKQKTRMQIGWMQIDKKYGYNVYKFYPKIGLYVIGNFFNIDGWRAKIGVIYWAMITFVSFFTGARLFRQGISTQDAWKLRARE